MSSVLRVHIYHSNKSEQLLRKIHSALAKRVGRVLVFTNNPRDADVVYGVYMSDDGKHRILRRLGVR